MYVAASLLSADFLHLEDELHALEEGGADLLHIDVMDGHFVPNLSFGPVVIKELAKLSKIPLDVHLMVENVSSFLPPFLALKPKFISFHLEAEKHPIRICQELRAKGVGAGIVLNPHSSIKDLEYLIEYVDLVLIMSVNPGFGGQSFLNHSLEKIASLRKLIERKNARCFIEVDGGVNGLNAALLEEAGADILVAGNYIFSSFDYKSAISSLKLDFG